jgi:hypothetical protein
MYACKDIEEETPRYAYIWLFASAGSMHFVVERI